MKVEKHSSKLEMEYLNKEIKGTQIKVGDIIQLDIHEVVPCDILLINTSDLQNNRFVCSVDSKFANGMIRKEKKAALDSTRPFGRLFADPSQTVAALERLSATVEYWPFKDNDEFKGTFKLKSDPKVEVLNDENIVRRGSILQAGRVTGVALYCGHTSLYYKNLFGNIRHKESSISRKIYWYSLATIVLNLVFSVISTMILMIKSDRVPLVQTLDPHIRDGLKIFSFIVLYSPVLPLFAKSIADLSNAIMAVWLEKKYKTFDPNTNIYEKLLKKMHNHSSEEGSENTRAKNSIKNIESSMATNALKVMNPYTVPNLGCVDSVYFDKTGTLTQTTFEVQSFATLRKMYVSRTDSFKIGGLTDVRGAGVDIDGVESERSYEGYDSLMYADGEIKKNTKKDEVQVYDFWARKVLPNPFAHMENYQNDTEEGEGDQDNEKFYKVSKQVKRIEKGIAGTSETNQKVERIYDEIEFMTDTKMSLDLKSFLQMLTVCHNAKVSGEEYVTMFPEEKCLLKFADQFNYSLKLSYNNPEFERDEDAYQKSYEVKVEDGSLVKYEIYLVNEQGSRRGRFSVIARREDSTDFYLFVRGAKEHMNNLIELGKSSNAFSRITRKNNEVGLQSYIFAKKKIKKEDVKLYVEKYKAIIQTSVDIERDLSALADSIENNLEVMAVVGLKNTLREDALFTVDKFKSMGIKVHMLTGDARENAIYTATSLNLIVEGSKNLNYMDFVDVADGRAKIKDILEKIKSATTLKKRGTTKTQISMADTRAGSSEQNKQIDTVSNFKIATDGFAFVLSGRTLEIIREDHYLVNHLAFVLQYAICIIGYEMKPNHKKDVLRLMKETNANGMIMAIGDGYNDIPMLEYANIGVQVASEHSHLVYGDIMVKDLSLIPELMMMDGSRYNSNLQLAVSGSFYNSMLVCSILFFFQFYSGFTSSAIIQSGFIYSTYGGYSMASIIFVFYENMYSNKTRLDLPALYKEHVFRNKLLAGSFFYLVRHL